MERSALFVNEGVYDGPRVEGLRGVDNAGAVRPCSEVAQDEA